ncbi:MAG: hypothetical protein PHW63_10150 [Alphaproteobacteria bacterium]|nr:hypothetical protein [Alphaproteobacteria bacterium]
MSDTRRLALILVSILLLVGVGYYLFQVKSRIISPFSRPAIVTPTSTTLYVTRLCPSCHRVDQYVTARDLTKHLDVKEIETDTAAFDQFALVARTCKLRPIIPLIWDGKTCLQGEDKVIDFLKNL